MVVDEVATDGESRSVWFFLFRAFADEDTDIGDGSISWDLFLLDEHDGVHAVDAS